MRQWLIAFLVLVAASFGLTPAQACCPIAEAAVTSLEAPCPFHQAQNQGDGVQDKAQDQSEKGRASAKLGCVCIAHSINAESADIAFGRDATAFRPSLPAAAKFISHLPEQATPPPKRA